MLNNAIGDFLYQHGTALVEGASGTLVVAAVVRHRPEWPLSVAKLYYWFFDSAQEVVSQRTGQPPPPKPPIAPPPQNEADLNPIPPAEPARK